MSKKYIHIQNWDCYRIAIDRNFKFNIAIFLDKNACLLRMFSKNIWNLGEISRTHFYGIPINEFYGIFRDRSMKFDITATFKMQMEVQKV